LKLTKQMLQAAVGVLLMIISLPISFSSSRRYAEKRYVVDAASCRMTIIVLQRSDVPDLPMPPEEGSVVLFHGLSANGLIMKYLARSFAELGVRVVIPDLPGHAMSPGPFTPDQAESCSAALLRGLAARGMIVPDHTILAGHSLGGAIALRIAEKFRPAGVIAISPAPMQTSHGIAPQNLLFHNLPKIVPNTRILSGQLEPTGLVDNAAELAASAHDPSVVFSVVPGNSHVSVLFSPTVARLSQEWAAKVLSLPQATRLPTRGNLLGCLLGLLGILLVAGPFLRDILGKRLHPDPAASPAAPWWRGTVELVLVSIAVVLLLRYLIPLHFIHLFEGDYLASFFLLVGAVIMAIHFRVSRLYLQESFATKELNQPSQPQISAYESVSSSKGNSGSQTKHANLRLLGGAAVAALLLHFLITSWFELTATSAWLTWQRWLRFPVFFVAAFCFLYALELLAGPVAERPNLRFVFWLLLIVLAWLSLALAIFQLKSGEILLILLSPYFLLQFIFSGIGIQLVRKLTGSATAAAVFGAILLAGFCLVLFPVS
jgi:pimeloyl-ACP methyl ester carboxylesterase